MAKQSTMDLTQGRPIKQILLFSLPLVMGTLFQQLYSFMDTVMVGRLISEDALAVNYFGFVGICFANPFAWGFALLYCTVLVFHFLRKRMRQAMK